MPAMNPAKEHEGGQCTPPGRGNRQQQQRDREFAYGKGNPPGHRVSLGDSKSGHRLAGAVQVHEFCDSGKCEDTGEEQSGQEENNIHAGKPSRTDRTAGRFGHGKRNKDARLSITSSIVVNRSIVAEE